ncbi:DUF2243 domain-containing protein [Bradyrhizobium sp. USDA 4486]
MLQSRVANFPASTGALLGLALGAFLDGIVFHQLLQWHHTLSGCYPLDSIDNVRLNTTWDGIFHGAAYVFVLAGLYLLWQRARGTEPGSTSRQCIGTVLLGWGIFNLVEGVVDHEILGRHRVKCPKDSASSGISACCCGGRRSWCWVPAWRELAHRRTCMRKVASTLVRSTPPAVVYLIFLLLLATAMAPPFRIVMFGLSLDDLLQLRCLASV